MTSNDSIFSRSPSGILPPGHGYRGEYTNGKLHWILRSGMTHVSGSVPFDTEADLRETVRSFTPVPDEQIHDWFARKRAHGFDYCVEMAMDTVNGILVSKTMTRFAEATFDEQCALYIMLVVFPKMVQEDVEYLDRLGETDRSVETECSIDGVIAHDDE